MRLPGLRIDRLAAIERGRFAETVQRHGIERVGGAFAEAALENVRRAAREREHVVAIGPGHQPQERERVKPPGHERQRPGLHGQLKHPCRAVGREDRQAVAGVLPETDIFAQCVEGLEQAVDLRAGMRVRKPRFEGLDEMAESRAVDEVLGHLAVRRHVEREAGGGVLAEQFPHRVARDVRHGERIAREEGRHRRKASAGRGIRLPAPDEDASRRGNRSPPVPRRQGE